MRLRSLGLSIISTLVVAVSASAHHSHGAYRITEYTRIEGVVTDFYWINPHAWIYLQVVDTEGQPEIWALESAGASTLLNIGVNRDDIKVGDTISAKCHQLRDGANGCLLGFITTANGVEKEWD